MSKNKNEILEQMLTSDKRYYLKRTGESATVTRLLRLGINAFLTNGNKKAFDIIATGNQKSITIQVKTSMENSFPTRFFQTYYDYTIPTPDFWVFVHTYGQNFNYQERYYVLSHEELKQIQGKIVLPYFKNLGARSIEDIMEIEKNKKTNKEKVGVDKVSIDSLAEHENRFDKIYKALNTTVLDINNII